MGKKRSNKRQKLENSESLQPLGSKVTTIDDSAKDDEERRLESALFGVPYTPGQVGDKHILVLSDDEDEEQDDTAGNELQGMLDSDVSISVQYYLVWPDQNYQIYCSCFS